MRGIHVSQPENKVASGITPAHAGNTCLAIPHTSHYWDHPRACGEYRQGETIQGATQGSPPRMRGILLVTRDDAKPVGITPAHAGNTR